MSAVFRRRGLYGLRAFSGALFAVSLIINQPAGAADNVMVTVDQAQLMRVPPRTSTIVVGNPLIADVSLQAGGILVVTGKGYGATNFLALDRSGNVLSERMLIVRGPTDNVVTVFSGSDRTSLSCEPYCQPRIMLGDANAYFSASLQQTGVRNGSASSGGAAAAVPAPR